MDIPGLWPSDAAGSVSDSRSSMVASSIDNEAHDQGATEQVRKRQTVYFDSYETWSEAGSDICMNEPDDDQQPLIGSGPISKSCNTITEAEEDKQPLGSIKSSSAQRSHKATSATDEDEQLLIASRPTSNAQKGPNISPTMAARAHAIMTGSAEAPTSTAADDQYRRPRTPADQAMLGADGVATPSRPVPRWSADSSINAQSIMLGHIEDIGLIATPSPQRSSDHEPPLTMRHPSQIDLGPLAARAKANKEIAAHFAAQSSSQSGETPLAQKRQGMVFPPQPDQPVLVNHEVDVTALPVMPESQRSSPKHSRQRSRTASLWRPTSWMNREDKESLIARPSVVADTDDNESRKRKLSHRASSTAKKIGEKVRKLFKRNDSAANNSGASTKATRRSKSLGSSASQIALRPSSSVLVSPDDRSPEPRSPSLPIPDVEVNEIPDASFSDDDEDVAPRDGVDTAPLTPENMLGGALERYGTLATKYASAQEAEQAPSSQDASQHEPSLQRVASHVHSDQPALSERRQKRCLDCGGTHTPLYLRPKMSERDKGMPMADYYLLLSEALLRAEVGGKFDEERIESRYSALLPNDENFVNPTRQSKASLLLKSMVTRYERQKHRDFLAQQAQLEAHRLGRERKRSWRISADRANERLRQSFQRMGAAVPEPGSQNRAVRRFSTTYEPPAGPSAARGYQRVHVRDRAGTQPNDVTNKEAAERVVRALKSQRERDWIG